MLINGDIVQYGLLMRDHWESKLKRSPDMCSEEIKAFLDEGLNNGAVGGKLIGAGGGGFLMFYAKNPMQLRKRLTKYKINEVKFLFDEEGTKSL